MDKEGVLIMFVEWTTTSPCDSSWTFVLFDINLVHPTFLFAIELHRASEIYVFR